MAVTAETSAVNRWKILRDAILSAAAQSSVQSDEPPPTGSVRSFSNFGLFNTSLCEDHRWRRYYPTQPTPCLGAGPLILDHTHTTTLQDMIGFNNTGNVCIWPSEEVLAHYCLQHASLFSGKRLVELGCGRTGLAGVILASTGQPDSLLLTDGHPDAVANVTTIVQRNADVFGSTQVSSEVLCWDNSLSSAHEGAFDWVLCADCLFFTELHTSLVQTIHKLLRPGSGQGLVLAPTRGDTLDQFVSVAAELFTVERTSCYDDVVYKRHGELLECEGVYNPDLHYPIMLTLTPLK